MEQTKPLVLVTGGLGYIGSNVAVHFLRYGYRVLIVDNLANSEYDRFKEIQKVCQLENIPVTPQNLNFQKVDLTKSEIVLSLFLESRPYLVIGLAGLKAVGESIEKPLDYYDTNITIVLNLVRGMQASDCHRLIFSSSATVYNTDSDPPFTESSSVGPPLTCPYAMTKYLIELILEDLTKYNQQLQICVLRYFNPVGNHPSGFLADNPKFPLNLLPVITNRLLTGQKLKVFGSDYETLDGTPLRDYIHVEDIASAHTVVLEKTMSNVSCSAENRYSVYNVGLEKPVSVLKIIDLYQTVNNIKIDYEITDRRSGDVPILSSNSKKLLGLGWTPKWKIEDCIQHCYQSYIQQQQQQQ